MLPADQRDAVTESVRAGYGDRTASIIGSAARTTGLLLRIQLQSTIMWLRAGGVVKRCLEEIEREGLVANELRAAGVDIAGAVPRADGSIAGLLCTGSRTVPSIGYVELRGTEVREPSMAQAEAFGASLRKLHGSALSRSAEALPTVEPLRNVDLRLSNAGKWLTAAEARELTSAVEQAQKRIRDARLSSGICHGDVRYANVRFEGERPTLFDLEALGLGPAHYDLACMWRRRLVETSMASVPEDWRWFRRGYEAAGRLSSEEWSLLPALACLRAFWTMTLPVEPDAAWGDAYRTSREYWQAHMAQIRWFADASRARWV